MGDRGRADAGIVPLRDLCTAFFPVERASLHASLNRVAERGWAVTDMKQD
jgi:hypothetical protein